MNTMEEILFVIGVGGAIFFGFGVLGFISDVILPRCKWLSDWIDMLPMIRDETNRKKNSY